MLQLQLKAEEDVIAELEKQYRTSLNEINKKIKLFEADIQLLDEAINTEGMDEAARALLQSRKRSKVYQKQFQEALQGQINGILDRMQGNNYSTIEGYLKDCYEDAYIGEVYNIHGQGIPIIMPIDQAAAVKAIMTDSKISKGLYTALGVDVKGLKKAIRQEITRGISSGLMYSEIARNISNTTKAPLARAKLIVRTEAHRIQQRSADDARSAAIKRGCDVVKQWSAALDGRTRPNHRRLDGQIKEEDEPFEIGGKKAMFPGDFGDPAEDCNCRCTCNTRARWALNEDELKTLQERAEYFGIDKTKDFEEFKNKYLNAVKDIENPENGAIIQPDKAMNERFKKLSEDVSERSGEISKILDEYSSRPSKWSGKTIVNKAEDMPGVSGRKEWTCDVTLRENSGIKTVIHEHLHARSVSYYTPSIYTRWENIEEGVIEIFAQEICKANGVPFKGSYAMQVKNLKIANSIMKEFESEFDFAKAIYEVDLPDRYSWLRTKADAVIAKDVLSEKTVQALNSAVDFFK